MNRSIVALLVLSVTAVAGAGCNVPVCGKGTQQKQDPDGTLRCAPVDDPVALQRCDVDGGAQIVGGVCTTRVICEPGTTMAMTTPDGKIVCVGTGGGDGCEAVKTPATGNISISGHLFDWETGLPSKRNVKFSAFEPLSFLAGNKTPLDAKTNDKGCFAFSDLVKPSSNLVALTVDDPDGGPDDLIQAASGAQVPVAGGSGGVYEVDLYFVKKSLVETWKTQAGGTDWTTKGSYLGCFYKDPFPMPNKNTLAVATMPAMGVKLLRNGVEPPEVKYFTDATTLSGSLTATGTFGCALCLPPLDGAGNPVIGVFTGMGGGVTWPNVPGSSAAQVLFFSRFHPM